MCSFVTSHPVTSCNDRWSAGGNAAGERRCRRAAMRVRLAEVALCERVFQFVIIRQFIDKLTSPYVEQMMQES